MKIEDALSILKWSCDNVDLSPDDRPEPCGQCDICKAYAVLAEACDELDFFNRRGDYRRSKT